MEEAAALLPALATLRGRTTCLLSSINGSPFLGTGPAIARAPSEPGDEPYVLGNSYATPATPVPLRQLAVYGAMQG